MTLLLAAALVWAADTAAAHPAANPWNGAWALDTTRSSPGATDAAAPGYVFTIRPDGRLRWEIPALQEVVRGRIDGRPMPIHSPTAPGGLTLSVRPAGPRVLRYAVALHGAPEGEGRMTLVDGGRAWVDISWPAGRPERARAVVYVRPKSDG